MKATLLTLFSFVLFLYSCGQNSSHSSTSEKTFNTAEPSLQLSPAEWKSRLTPTQYFVLREKGTEKPFSGEFVFTKEKGTYKCGACGEPLFTHEMKFESHCGWPSFDKEIAGRKIIQTEDNSNGMKRVEITCAKCGGHLGHIFDDGPTETGKRYCVNSASLSFEPLEKSKDKVSSQTITLAGGCFWCIEAIFEELKGVEKVVSGYSGGATLNPTYAEVCSGNTGHAESVQITYNPKILSLEQLLEVFFSLHDPTSLNRQGADVGTQYRSAIFYQNEEQKKTAEKVIAILNANKAFERPIVTEVTAYSHFYSAENYHQEYYALNKEQPYCKVVIKPKMDKLHKLFAEKLKK